MRYGTTQLPRTHSVIAIGHAWNFLLSKNFRGEIFTHFLDKDSLIGLGHSFFQK